MTLFHRHLTRSFLRNLIRAVLVLMAVVMFFHLPSLGPGMGDFLALCLSIAGLVLPSAFLVAALFTVGNLAHNHELTALKASGCSLLRIMWPVILIGAASVPLAAVLPGAGWATRLPVESGPAAETAVHAGRAYPLANLVAVLIGVSLAATPRQKSAFVGFMGAALVLGAYFVVSATANALGRHGGLPPLLAGWLPTVLFAGFAGLSWWKADR